MRKMMFAMIAATGTALAVEPSQVVVDLLEQCPHDCTKPAQDALNDRQSCIREAGKDAPYDLLVDAIRRAGMAAFPVGGRSPQCGGFVPPDKFEPGNKAIMWLSSMESDPMSDQRQCVMTPRGGREVAAPFVFLGAGGWSISLIGEAYPGRPSQVRIDKRTAHASPDHDGFYGAKAKAVMAEMRAGNAVKTELIEWPSGAPIYWDGSLDGFAKVADQCEAWVKKGIKP